MDFASDNNNDLNYEILRARSDILLKSLPIAVAIYDLNGFLVFINDAYVKLAGLKDKQAHLDSKLNIFTVNLFPKTLQSKMRANNSVDFRLSIDFDNPITIRLLNSTLHGLRYFDFMFRTVTDNKGEKLNYMLIARDITEEHNLNEALIKNRNKFLLYSKTLNTIIENLPYLIFIKDIDNDFKYIKVNSLLCKYIGMSYDKVIGKTDYDLFSNEIADKMRADDKVAVNAEKFYSCKKEVILQNIKYIFNTTKITLKLMNGRNFLIGVCFDISHQEEINEQLKFAKEKAEQADSLKSAFLANMSHEIRTPLNSIIGFSSIMAKTDDPQEREEFGRIVRSNNDQLLKLIDSILDISKIESGYIEIHKINFDLAELMSDMEKNFAAQMKNGVGFVYKKTFKSFVIYTDKDRLTEAINNFISNAMKHTETGTITLGCTIDGGYAKIYVSDTGRGISSENKKKLFGRFEKLDAYSQGAGLGLAITKAIAIKLGGNVGVESKLGKGSTFWISIPV